MSTYGQKRDDEYLNRLKSSGPISDFITSYNANLSAPHRTIFLFPGGMGPNSCALPRMFIKVRLFLPYGVDRSIHLGGDGRQPADTNTA
jgi:hypothetical protein